MTRDRSDELTLLADANPARVAERADESEQAQKAALLERIVAEPVREPGPTASRRGPAGPRRFAPAGAGAVALAAVAALLLVPAGRSGDAVARTVEALTGKPGVFHVVARTSSTDAGGAPTHAWTETWASTHGRQRHLVYDVRADGRRGQLVAETVGATTVILASPRDGGPIADGGEAAVRPRSYVLDLLRRGRVAKQSEVTFAGRKAWRFEIRTTVQNTAIQSQGRHVSVPPSIRRSTLIVDGRTHLPLLLRTNGVVPSVDGTRVTFPRVTTTARFSAFERLTDAAGAASLRPSARFRRR